MLSHQDSVGGVTVSMVAFQAIDPGSTPGRRTKFFIFSLKLNYGSFKRNLDIIHHSVQLPPIMFQDWYANKIPSKTDVYYFDHYQITFKSYVC